MKKRINPMKAVTRSRGSITFNNKYAKPKCGPHSLLVRVTAASINPVDYKVGWPVLGSVVGMDVAGVVEEKGDKVSENINVGDEVFGSAGTNGSLAEYTIVDPKHIALKPSSVSFAEAATLNVTHITSLQGLRDYGKLQEGDRVLIIGASGGCGTAAVQLASTLGAKDIVGVCSGRNAELVRSLGATDIIDYTQQTVRDFYLSGEQTEVPEEKKFDVIYDTATNSGAGEDYKDTCMQLLKKDGERHGQYVAICGYRTMWLRLFTIGFKKNQHLFLAKADAADYEYLAKLADSNQLKSIK